MAVAHDAATESATWTTTPDPFTFSHTPSGTPRGVLVFIFHGSVSTDLITSVSYGGVAMARVTTAADTATEAGRSYCYFLGDGIPTGTQTVSIDHTATSTVKIATCVTLTANGPTEVRASGVVQENAANPQVTLDSAGDVAARYFAIYSGLPNTTDLTLISGMTAVSDHDFGAFVGRVDRQTTPGSGSAAVGYTSGSDDAAMVAVAVAEEDLPAAWHPMIGDVPQRNWAVRRQAAAALIALAPSFFFIPSPTRFYLSGDPGPPAVTAVVDSWGDTNTLGMARLQRQRTGSGEVTESVTTELGLTLTRSMRQYVSDRLAAQTISGTFKGQIRCGQSAGEVHSRVHVSVRVFSEDGSTLRGTLLTLGPYGNTNTYSTDPTFTNRIIANSDALGTLAVLPGDRLVVEVGTGSMIAEVGGTVSFKFHDAAPDLPENETETGAQAAWVEFSQTLLFQDPIDPLNQDSPQPPEREDDRTALSASFFAPVAPVPVQDPSAEQQPRSFYPDRNPRAAPRTFSFPAFFAPIEPPPQPSDFQDAWVVQVPSPERLEDLSHLAPIPFTPFEPPAPEIAYPEYPDQVARRPRMPHLAPSLLAPPEVPLPTSDFQDAWAIQGSLPEWLGDLAHLAARSFIAPEQIETPPEISYPEYPDRIWRRPWLAHLAPSLFAPTEPPPGPSDFQDAWVRAQEIPEPLEDRIATTALHLAFVSEPPAVPPDTFFAGAWARPTEKPVFLRRVPALLLMNQGTLIPILPTPPPPPFSFTCQAPPATTYACAAPPPASFACQGADGVIFTVDDVTGLSPSGVEYGWGLQWGDSWGGS